MSDFVSLNQHQKKALVIELYKQGKIRRQIAEVVHMGFKDIADVIKKHTGEDSDSADRPEKSKDARAFELFLHPQQPVEVAIELNMSADEVEELYVQYWRLSKLHGIETLYHEAKYSLSSFLHLFKILKDKRITKEKDIYDLIKYANHDLPSLTSKIQQLTNDVVDLELKKKDSKAVLMLWNAQLSDLGQNMVQYQSVIDTKKPECDFSISFFNATRLRCPFLGNPIT